MFFNHHQQRGWGQVGPSPRGQPELTEPHGMVAPAALKFHGQSMAPSKFANFASQFFINGVYDKSTGEFFNNIYDQRVNYKNTATENEKNLVNFLQLFDTGLQLMKGDNEMNNWSLLY